jgi:hypothetical protein
VPYQDLKRFRKNDFGFRNEVVEGTELKKEKLELAETELQQLTTLKVNFEDLEKKKTFF